MDKMVVNNYLKLIEQAIAMLKKVSALFKGNSDSNDELLIKCSDSLNSELYRIKNLIAIIDNKRKLNQPFINFQNKRIEENAKIITDFLSIRIDFLEIKRLTNAIQKCSEIMDDSSSYDLFDQFKYGDSNYILFGKNGAGKTSLLTILSQRLNISNVIFSSATRNINYSNNVLCRPSDINLKNALKQTENFKTMYYLSQCIRNVENNERRAHLLEEEIITNKIIRIFNSLGLERKLNILSNGELELTSKIGQPYSLEYASDGEKSVLYFLMVSLLAEENSFVFIDEPENHLNGSLMQKLFDSIELERKDIIYVYATHNVHFIEGRTNVELVYLEKTNNKNKWVYKKFENYKELPLDLILTIEGTSDDVIFCEGEDNGSYDNKLLKELYPNFQIIASQGCEKVTLQTIIFNNNSTILRKKAYGLVDFDFREEDEISELNKKNVHVLKVNEIENIFVLEICIYEIKELLNFEKTMDDIKDSLIQIISRKLLDIKKDFATKALRRLNKKNKINDIENIEESLKKLNDERNAEFLLEYKKFGEELDLAINNMDYNQLMKIVPGKMLLKSVANIFGLSEQTYIQQIFIRIRKSEKLKKELRKFII